MGCGDGELVMVVEGAVKKPPPGRVTFPTQVELRYFGHPAAHLSSLLLGGGSDQEQLARGRLCFYKLSI